MLSNSPYGPDPVEIHPWAWTVEARRGVRAALPLANGPSMAAALVEIAAALATYRGLLDARKGVKSWSKSETRRQLEKLKKLGEQLRSITLSPSTRALLDDVAKEDAHYSDTLDECVRLAMLLEARAIIALHRLNEPGKPGPPLQFTDRYIADRLAVIWTRYTGLEVRAHQDRDNRKSVSPFVGFLRATMGPVCLKFAGRRFDGRRLELEIARESSPT